MDNPFEVLGLQGWADQDEIRSAYRMLVKRYHPDMIQDPAMKKEAQARMVALNLAYEEALRLAAPGQKKHPSGMEEINPATYILLAERALARGNPEMALHHLTKCDQRTGDWYYVQGRVLMAMDQYESAHQSFREAVRLCPENNVYRSGALAAAVAHRKAGTLQGRVRKAWKKIIKK